MHTSVIVPTLPDFSRHRIGHKQYQSKYHHDRHFGPFFEDPLNTSGTFQVGFHEGTESILNCRVGMLKDKTVIISKVIESRLKQTNTMINFFFKNLYSGHVGEKDCR